MPRMPESKQQRMISEMLRSFADHATVISAGWYSYVKLSKCEDNLENMEKFFAGATYIFEAMMGMMEEGDEPTPKDLKRMDAIADEVGRFDKYMRRKYGAGTA